MAEHETVQREQVAYRRVLAAIRKIAKSLDVDNELTEGVTNAYHQDTDVRDMRRMEAFAPFLESVAEQVEPNSKPKGNSKADKE